VRIEGHEARRAATLECVSEADGAALNFSRADFDATLIRILFIGNSYTARHQLPRLVADLAATADASLRIEPVAIVAGGASLRRHWNAGLAQETLAKSAWDFVVLQEQSTLPVKNKARYHDNVRLFAGEVANHGAALVLYLTWERQGAITQSQIDRAVEEIAAETGARVVPVGPAWQRAMRECPQVPLYLDDGSHPTEAGAYLAACMFVVALFGLRPVGFDVSDNLGLDRSTATAFQRIAFETIPRS
jgi:hypothetical protein